jgi:predicted RNA-binding Zn-ribbon protein involved in translation (DUF1610 family)
MPSRKKIDLEKVLASLHTLCPKCGYKIQPAEIRRIGLEMICPACGAQFQAGKSGARLNDSGV